jgi:hypothetical protein
VAKNLYKTGDQFAEKGTTPWADWQRSRMKHALKDVHFEARQIVQVIRDMCEGEAPAWHLMTRPDGIGFGTFEAFVTSPDGLQYTDYAKFRGMAVSEPGVMNEREYDLLTKAPDGRRDNKRGGKDDSSTGDVNQSRLATRLRAINRAPALIRGLYVAGLIDAKLAELLGPDKGKKEAYADRKAKAARALTAIRAIARNGDDAAYRKEVNDAVRREFPRPAPSRLDRLRKLWAEATAAERRAFLKEVGGA